MRGLLVASLLPILSLAGCEDISVPGDASGADARTELGMDGGGNTAKGDAAASAKEAGLEVMPHDSGLADGATGMDARVSERTDGGPDAEAGKAIGAAGGTLESEDGRARLGIPAGALAEPTTLTIERVEVTDTSGLASDVYDLGPDGTFSTDVEVCLASKDGADTTHACLGYFDEKTKGWQCEDACVASKGDGLICGDTNHFTSFAVLLGGGSTKGDPCNDDYIFSKGGAVVSPDGLATLSIPQDALAEGKRISVSEPNEPAGELGSKIYAFLPDGLAFAKDATLCIQPTVGADTTHACLGYFDENTKGWKCEDTCVPSKGDGLICGDTNHFTNFAVLLGGGSTKGDACNDDYISPEGGSVISPDGHATLSIPKGALAEGQRISVSEPSEPTGKLGSKVYEFLPGGLTFEQDSTLCIQASDGVDTSNACLGYFDERTKGWKCEDTCVASKGDGLICGNTNHFTSFAILLSGGSTKGEPCEDKIISTSGGTLTAPDGKTTLSVPLDAVRGPTRFTITESGVDSSGFGSKVYALSPAGSTFAKPLELCLPTTLSGNTDAACLGYQNGDGKWVCQDECVTAKDNLLCGETDHFTNFAILLSGGSCK